MSAVIAFQKTLSRLIPHCKSLIPNRRCFSAMSRPRIFVTRPDIPQGAIDLMCKECDVDIWHNTEIDRSTLLSKVKGINGIYCSVACLVNDEFLYAAGPNLKVISTMSVGVDHIDLEACKRRNIKVGHTPGVLTDAVAELCLGLLLATSRRLIEANREVTNGGWRAANVWGPMYMTGSQLKGSTVGIIGLGRIGFAIAKRLKAFEVDRILYSGNQAKPYAQEVNGEFVTLENLLRNSDFVIVSCSLTRETVGLINARAFKLMKNSAIFVNISRGHIVDQDALLEALTSREIKAAGLDVTTPEPIPEDHPLTKLDNCVILPHIGSATTQTRLEMAVMTSQNLIAGIKGEEMPARLV